MRLLLRASLLILLSTLSTASARAEARPPSAGAIPIDELGLFTDRELSVEINLDGPLLKLVGEASRSADPEFANLVSGLEAIRVRVAPVKGSAEAMRSHIAQTVRWLESHGWQTIVRVRETTHESYIYVKQGHSQIVGLAVLSFDPGKDAALINIVGRLDPAQLGRLGRGLNLPQLENAPKPPSH